MAAVEVGTPAGGAGRKWWPGLLRASQQGLEALSITARLRALLRRRETWLVVLATFVGALAGLVVNVLREIAYLAQSILYQLPAGQRLSALSSLPLQHALVPAFGGLLLGLTVLALQKRRQRYVDLVEANALHGGKLPLVDSLIITGQTVISNGAGASVGLEAAYTQLSGMVASKLGELFQLRRADLRKIVGCGAAGAIAAAFGAPLTGAFYAFELIIGTYTISTLAPVVAASISAVLVGSLFGHGQPIVAINYGEAVDLERVLLILVVGLLTAGVGILLMRLVSAVEGGFAKVRIPTWARPMAGGLLVGALALASPTVLSAGHGALERAFIYEPMPLLTALAIVVLKIMASAISLGSGFRGGLFFASLFLGAMLGQIFFALLMLVDPSLFPNPSVLMLVGMAGLATAVVGGPLTMAFLALETSGSLPLTIAVLAAAVASSLLVRETFGYSFTTWRFHLRGETIRSAHDIGWMRSLTVGKMMRRDVRTVPATMTVREFRRSYPLGAATSVIALRDDGRYAGLVDVRDAYDQNATDETVAVANLMKLQGVMLHPAMSAADAEAVFEKEGAEALVVVSDLAERTVIGTLTEAYLLRRYSNELEKVTADLSR